MLGLILTEEAQSVSSSQAYLKAIAQVRYGLLESISGIAKSEYELRISIVGAERFTKRPYKVHKPISNITPSKP